MQPFTPSKCICVKYFPTQVPFIAGPIANLAINPEATPGSGSIKSFIVSCQANLSTKSAGFEVPAVPGNGDPDDGLSLHSAHTSHQGKEYNAVINE